MTMPQFTAEASLYRTRGQYRTGVQVNKLATKRLARSTRRGRWKKRSTSIVARPAGPILGGPAGQIP